MRIAVFDTPQQHDAWVGLLEAATAVVDAFEGVNSETLVEAVMASAKEVLDDQWISSEYKKNWLAEQGVKN